MHPQSNLAERLGVNPALRFWAPIGTSTHVRRARPSVPGCTRTEGAALAGARVSGWPAWSRWSALPDESQCRVKSVGDAFELVASLV
jgi:hypothetical protein